MTHLVKQDNAISRRYRYAAGQAAAELALLATTLVLMLAVAVEMGRLGYLAMTLDDAARAGAQYGSQNYTTDGNISGMTTAATNAATNINGTKWWGSSAGFSTSASSFCECNNGTVVTCPGTCSSGAPLIYVQVKTQANYVPFLQVPGLPSTFTIHGLSTMAVQ
jgi:hypothetical protein